MRVAGLRQWPVLSEVFQSKSPASWASPPGAATFANFTLNAGAVLQTPVVTKLTFVTQTGGKKQNSKVTTLTPRGVRVLEGAPERTCQSKVGVAHGTRQENQALPGRRQPSLALSFGFH